MYLYSLFQKKFSTMELFMATLLYLYKIIWTPRGEGFSIPDEETPTEWWCNFRIFAGHKWYYSLFIISQVSLPKIECFEFSMVRYFYSKTFLFCSYSNLCGHKVDTVKAYSCSKRLSLKFKKKKEKNTHTIVFRHEAFRGQFTTCSNIWVSVNFIFKHNMILDSKIKLDHILTDVYLYMTTQCLT